MYNTIIGIDPGAAGGLAIWTQDGFSAAVKMPATEGDLVNILSEWVEEAGARNVIVYMENLVKFMGANMPSSAMATYAGNWGFIKGVVMGMRVRMEIITPQTWQKELALGITGRQKSKIVPGMSKFSVKDEKARVSKINAQLKTAWKNKLKSEAQRLYPNLISTLKTADAILILEYGRRINR